MTYAGAVRVPNSDGTSATTNSLGYGGHALGYNAANNSLFYGGHDWYQRLAEIAIPATLSLTSNATVLQPRVPHSSECPVARLQFSAVQGDSSHPDH